MLPRWLMVTTKNWVPGRFALASALLGLFLLAGCQEPGPRALLEGETLVKEGKYEEARKVDLLPSDRTLILLKIVQATKP